jgi:hypothetical protein
MALAEDKEMIEEMFESKRGIKQAMADIAEWPAARTPTG